MWGCKVCVVIGLLSVVPAYGQEFAPDYHSSRVPYYMEVGKNWLTSQADDTGNEILFRRFALDDGGFRNVFVLTCEKAGLIRLELVPPKKLLSNLEKITGNNEINRAIHTVHPNFTSSHQGTFDRIAAWFAIRADHLEPILSNLGDADYRIFFGDSFGYGLKETYAVTQQVNTLPSNPNLLQARGTSRLLSWQNTMLECLRYSGR